VGEALEDLTEQIVTGQVSEKECQHGFMFGKKESARKPVSLTRVGHVRAKTGISNAKRFG
jgi:hypothetical protein